ncbi:MAG: hypothetical protein JXA90_15970 [Planctomycetes bacterium]|nr:hypothetical protein [Planctomycetota bacterium]
MDLEPYVEEAEVAARLCVVAQARAQRRQEGESVVIDIRAVERDPIDTILELRLAP